MLKLRSTIPSFYNRISTKIFVKSESYSLNDFEYDFLKDDGEEFKLDFLNSINSSELATTVLNIVLNIDKLSKDSTHSLEITKEAYKLWIIYNDVDNGMNTIKKVINTMIDSEVSMELNSAAFSMIHKLLPHLISIPRLIGECSDKDEFSHSYSRSTWKMESVSSHGKYVEVLLNEVPLMMQFIEVENGNGDNETLFSNTILNGAITLLGDTYKVLPFDDREHLRIYLNRLVGGNILTNGFIAKSGNIRTTKEQFVVNGSVAYNTYDDDSMYEVFTSLPTAGFAVSKHSIKSNPINPKYTSLMTWVNPEGNFRYLKINKYSEVE